MYLFYSQEVIFRKNVSNLFNTDWHKIHLGLQADKVDLHIDCHFIERKPLNVMGQLDLYGQAEVAKRFRDKKTVGVDVEWLAFDCDPAEQDWTCPPPPPPPLACIECPQGPAGEKGDRGERGNQGVAGEKGATGFPGMAAFPVKEALKARKD